MASSNSWNIIALRTLVVTISFLYVANTTTAALGNNTRLVWTELFVQDSQSRINSLPADPAEYISNQSISTTFKYQEVGRNFVAITNDYSNQSIFFSDAVSKTIFKGSLADGVGARAIFQGTSAGVEGIAVDWIAKNLYWADSVYDWILISNYEGTRHQIIIDFSLDKPRAIVVYPQKGFIFVTDLGAQKKIARLTLAGTNWTDIITTGLFYPNGLSIDYTTDFIYWVDANPEGSRLESCDLDGNHRRLIYSLTRLAQAHFFDVTPFQNYLFITDLIGKLHCLKNDTQESYFSLNLGTSPHGIMTYGADQQPSYPDSPCLSRPCEHFCIHMPERSYQCKCGFGYEMASNGSCVKDNLVITKPQFLVIFKTTICAYPYNLADVNFPDNYEPLCFVKNRTYMIALAMDVNAELLFFSDYAKKAIYRVRIVANGKVEKIMGGVGSVEGLAVDYLNDNLYWTDYQLNHLVVSRYDGSRRKVLIDTDILKPRSLVVHPGLRKIFWTEFGPPTHIEMADLDGKNRQIVVATGASPSGLAYDDVTGRLFYGETSLGTIFSVNIDGTGLSRIHSRFKMVPFFDMEIFQDLLVWTEWGSTNGIHALNLESGSLYNSLTQTNSVYGIGLYADSKQKANGSSACNTDDIENGDCDQLCLPSAGSGFTCLCTTGYELQPDGSCLAEAPQTDNFMLVTDSYAKTIFQVNLTSSDQSYTAIPVIGLNNPIAVAYDPVEMKLYWSDVLQKTISRANLNGTNQEIVISEDLSTCDGLTVDYISRLLFWTDAGTDLISVSKLDGTYRKIILREGNDQPRAIVVDPFEGLLFWTDWGTVAKIQRSNMDGTQKRALVEGDDLAWPNGLTIDYRGRKLYWCDAKVDRIEMCKYDGSQRILLIDLGSEAHPFGIAVYGNTIFWTDWLKNSLMRADKFTGENNGTTGYEDFARLNGITVYSTLDSLSGANRCSNNNCSHLCIPVLTGRVCACEEGSALNEGGLTCQSGGPQCPRNVPAGHFPFQCDLLPGSACNVVCDEGYFTPYENYICLESAQWDYPLNFTCQRVTCPLLLVNNFTEVKLCPEETVYGTECVFECQLGYTRDNGDLNRKCQADGTWSGGDLVCKRSICPPPPKALNGTYYPDNCTTLGGYYGDTCQLMCRSGYQALGIKSRSCLVDKRWSDLLTVSKCLDTTPPVLNCPSQITVVAHVEQNTFLFQKFDVNGTDNSGRAPTITYNLPPEVYLDEGKHQIIATAKDESDNQATCSFNITVFVERCPILAHPINGASTSNCGNYFGAVCTFRCSEGFRLIGPSIISCLKNENATYTWNGTSPTCSAVTCPEPEVNPHGVREGCAAPFSYNVQCGFRCNIGYQQEGGARLRQCQQNGTWSGSPITCSAKTCDFIPSPEHGSVLPESCALTGGTFGTACMYSCDDGYELLGFAQTTCLSSGRWTEEGQPTLCVDKSAPHFNGTCPDDIPVTAPKNSTTAVVTWTEPTVMDNEDAVLNVSSSPSSGSTFSEDIHTVRITAFDTSGNKGSCVFQINVTVIRCPVQPALNRAFLVYDCDNHYGEICNFSCGSGMHLIGSPSIECTCDGSSSYGTWSAPQPTCEAQSCQSFSKPENVIVEQCDLSAPNQPLGTRCWLQCEAGFENDMDPGTEWRCLENGSWTGDAMVCTGVRCPPLSPRVNQTLVPSRCFNGSSAGDTCTFSCDDGYDIVGPSEVMCKSSGQWNYDGEIPVCQDVTPPTFIETCPIEIMVHSNESCPSGGMVMVSYNRPTATDNSGIITYSPSEERKSEGLRFGNYVRSYVARDSAGLTATCDVILNITVTKCPQLISPSNGHITSQSCYLLYGSVTTFSCKSGYTLAGSSTTTCQANGHWSNHVPTCRGLSLNCGPLTPFGLSVVENRRGCYDSGLANLAICHLHCTMREYALIGIPMMGNDGILMCDFGTYHPPLESFRCIDNQQPSLTCPESVLYGLPPNANKLNVTWTMPVASDNTGSVTLEGPPAWRYSGVGLSWVEYTARDPSHNTRMCRFSVTVVDLTPPSALNCSNSSIIVTNTLPVILTWKTPAFQDNVGVESVESNNRPGEYMWGWGIHNVAYRAYDAAGNVGVCSFFVKVVDTSHCSSLEEPPNGHIVCNNSGKQCRVECDEGYFMNPNFNVPEVFVCEDDGMWNNVKNPIIPACSKRIFNVSRNDIMQFTLHGDCEANKEEIRQQFIQLLSSWLRRYCAKDPAHNCQLDNTRIDCVGSSRSKRQAEPGMTNVNMTYSIQLYSNITSGNFSDLETALDFDLTAFFSKGNVTFDLDDTTVILQKNNSMQGTPYTHCSEGYQVVGLACMICSVGSYYRMRMRTCELCPLGQYQTAEGQLYCDSCPPGKKTRAPGANSDSYCKDVCQPGEYSYFGLAPCHHCNVSSYQSNLNSRACIPCPGGTTTRWARSSHLSDCKSTAPRTSRPTAAMQTTDPIQPTTRSTATLSITTVATQPQTARSDKSADKSKATDKLKSNEIDGKSGQGKIDKVSSDSKSGISLFMFIIIGCAIVLVIVIIIITVLLIRKKKLKVQYSPCQRGRGLIEPGGYSEVPGFAQDNLNDDDEFLPKGNHYDAGTGIPFQNPVYEEEPL